MVDPVGTKPASVVDRRPLTVVAAETVAAPQPVKSGNAQAEEAGATVLARSMAAQAPVDTDRVARIRKAVQEGRFPIYPATVADRLLALKLEWNPND